MFSPNSSKSDRTFQTGRSVIVSNKNAKPATIPSEKRDATENNTRNPATNRIKNLPIRSNYQPLSAMEAFGPALSRCPSESLDRCPASLSSTGRDHDAQHRIDRPIPPSEIHLKNTKTILIFFRRRLLSEVILQYTETQPIFRRPRQQEAGDTI
jgi:hypothetical protein